MLRYKSGSTGEEIELSGEKIRTHIKTAGLYDYEWEIEETKLALGSKVTRIVKKSEKYKMLIDFCGNANERAEAAEKFFRVTERDVITEKPGKLIFKNSYIACYIIGSKYENSKNARIVRKETTVYAPYPFWIREKEYSFHAQNKTSTDNKIYPLKYPFRYANGMENTYIINPHFTDANFLLRVYGPSVNPLVNIGGYPYLVNTVLEKGEYLEINSLEGTVEKTMNDGERINIFHTRAKGTKSVFKKIPAGRQNITWPGEFDFDLIIYEERSEPKWNG